MRKLQLLLLVCFSLLINSCSDSTSPDDGGGGDNNRFSVVSISQDSVYWGETVTVSLRNAQTNAFTLFVGTMKIDVESATREANGDAMLTFRVPEGSSTGMIRVYEHDTIEAAQSQTLVVLEKLLSAMRPSFEHFAPGRVYPGDLFAITGRDIPMRWRDMEAKIGDVPLEIISWDDVRIFTRVPVGAKTGPVTLRMFEETFNLGTVEVLEFGTFMPEATLSHIRVYTARMQGSVRQEFVSGADTIVEEALGRLSDQNWIRDFDRITLQRSGDSLIGVSEQIVDGAPMRLELRLKLEPENRVSGRLNLLVGSQDFTSFLETEIKSMRWYLTDGVYIIGTHSIDLPKELISFRAGQRVPGATMTMSYVSGEPTSVINIDLGP